MKSPSRTAIGWFVGLALILGIAVAVYLRSRLSGPIVLNAPPPLVVADSLETEPELGPSSIDVLVTYKLSPAVDSLEAAVPKVYGDINHKLPISGTSRANFAYAVSRSPFRVAVSQQTLTISADIAYQGRVWYRPPIGSELSAGCGTDSEQQPRVRATIGSTVQLTPEWQLRTNTRVFALAPLSNDERDRCLLTMLRIDVTDLVIDETKRMLDQNLQQFDREVARWPVRERFEEAWSQLQQRIDLGNGISLDIAPFAAQFGPFGAERDTVTARLRILARPRVVTGAPVSAKRPLPPLQPGADLGHGARVAVEASFSYPVATALLREALVGKRLEQDGQRVEIRDVQLTGIGGGRVALGVTLAGRVSGRLYFTGTPRLDPVHHEISVPDLGLDVGTSQALVHGFAWLNGVNVRDYLRARARLPDSQASGMFRDFAESQLDRTLAPGVTLSARIHDARAISVHATKQELRLRAVADAEFKLAIDRAPVLPKLAQMAKGEREPARPPASSNLSPRPGPRAALAWACHGEAGNILLRALSVALLAGGLTWVVRKFVAPRVHSMLAGGITAACFGFRSRSPELPRLRASPLPPRCCASCSSPARSALGSPSEVKRRAVSRAHSRRRRAGAGQVARRLSAVRR